MTTDWNRRTVLEYDGEIIVIDNIFSRQNNYAVQWNLPENTTVIDRTFEGISTSGNSKIRLTFLSSDDANASVSFPPASSFLQSSGSNINVRTVELQNSGIGAPYECDFFSFITCMEIREQADNYSGPAYSLTANPDANIVITRPVGTSGITRFVFVNRITSGNHNAITINNVTTDALFGIMDFRGAVLDNILAFDITMLNNNGVNVNIVPGEANSFALKKVVANLAITQNTVLPHLGDLELRNISVYAPATLTVTNAHSITIKPETILQRGSHAQITPLP
jgi:hypothetical protein